MQPQSSSSVTVAPNDSKTYLTVLIVLIAFAMLMFDMVSYGSFSATLEAIANRTGSDEKLFFDVGVCIYENGVLNYLDRCSLSPKPFLIGVFIAQALSFGDLQSVVFAVSKFVFCWAIIMFSVVRLCARCPEFDQNLILFVFLANRFWAHLHVQLLRDDLIAAVGIATLIELYLFLVARRQLWRFNLYGSLFLVLRPEMFAIYLILGNLFGVGLKVARRSLMPTASMVFFLILLATYHEIYFPRTSLLSFDLLGIIDGFRKAFLSPMPQNAVLDIGDMRFVPVYSFFTFFLSVFSAMVFAWSVLQMLNRIPSKTKLLKFGCFVVIPMSVVLAYSLIETDVQGPRQSLACSMTIFAFWIAPIVFKRNASRRRQPLGSAGSKDLKREAVDKQIVST